jgi:hypothetical protein
MVERFAGIEHEFLQETIFCWSQFYLFASNSYLPLAGLFYLTLLASSSILLISVSVNSLHPRLSRHDVFFMMPLSSQRSSVDLVMPASRAASLVL